MIGFGAEWLMQLETTAIYHAAPGERSADRQNQRNGYRDRDWACHNWQPDQASNAASDIASTPRGGTRFRPKRNCEFAELLMIHI